MKDLITIREAERLFGLPETALRAAVGAGYIKMRKQGRQHLLSRSELASHPETRRERSFSQTAVQIGFLSGLPVPEARRWLGYKFDGDAWFDRYVIDRLVQQFREDYSENYWREA